MEGTEKKEDGNDVSSITGLSLLSGAGKKENRISNITGLSMLSVAGLYDLIGLIPFMSMVLMPIAWGHFWLWFIGHDVNLGFRNPKRLAIMAIGGLIEIIPALSELSPTWILAIGIQLLFVRVEDKTGISLKKSPEKLKEFASGRLGQKLGKRAAKGPRKNQTRREQREAINKQRETIKGAQRMHDVRERRKNKTHTLTS